MNKAAKIISACVAFAAAAGLGILAYDMTKYEKMDIPVSITETTRPATEPPTEPPTTKPPEVFPEYDEFVPSAEGIMEKSKIMLHKNRDYAGWIKIANTNVDYPFLKDPGEIKAGQSYYGGEAYDSNEYYLHRNFNRNYEFAGALFMDYRNNFDSIEDNQSENIIIYGHNMMNYTMFGSLRQYYSDYSFINRAHFIEISSLYHDYDYVICGCSVTSGYYESDFVYWNMEELDTEEDFNFFMGKVREKQLFDTGVDVKYGDKLLTLSTCYGVSESNQRFILVARRLRAGEGAGDMSTIQRT
ncbi:MAG: class B sortase [Ruminococcus sp.]|nr:class B sortase [Ruminococcus sp.]